MVDRGGIAGCTMVWWIVRQTRYRKQDEESKEGGGRAIGGEYPISCIRAVNGHSGVTGHRQLGKIVMVAAPQVWEYVPPLRRVVLPLTAVRSVRKMGGIEAIVWTWGG